MKNIRKENILVLIALLTFILLKLISIPKEYKINSVDLTKVWNVAVTLQNVKLKSISCYYVSIDKEIIILNKDKKYLKFNSITQKLTDKQLKECIDVFDKNFEIKKINKHKDINFLKTRFSNI